MPFLFRKFVLATFAVLLLLPAACSEGQGERRQLAGGAVASAHPLASRAGMEILRQGGNAFDAAVAVSAALAVVEPWGSGVGGGGFWLMHLEDEARQFMLDGRETAPGEAHRDMYLDEDGEVDARASREGPLAAGIPGLPAALVHISEHYGRLPLSRSLAPAIRYAREGVPVGPRYVRGAERRKALFLRWPAAAEVFLDNGEVPEEGWLLRQPDLAATLERIAEHGRAGFYEGELAQRMVDGVREAGGIWSLEDLAAYEVLERDPVVTHHRGARIVTAPPPSAGGIILAATLNILDGFDLEAMDEATRAHVTAEALRRAYRERGIWLGDPGFVEVPVERLIHPWYAAGLRASIRTDHATPSEMLPGVIDYGDGIHTTHFSVIDGDGNRVGGTQTINFWFGSGFMPPGTGVLLNNEMDDFSSQPGAPDGFGLVSSEANAIAPGKRPASSMTPTFVEREDGAVAVLGSPGGSRIVTTVFAALNRFLDGGDARDMAADPRLHHQYLPDRIEYEQGALSDEAVGRLREMGHEVRMRESPMGNIQIVVRRPDGSLDAASDPRGEGDPDVY
jgi:gamma-glutamyltranspeptidase/glutathione hydrolase